MISVWFSAAEPRRHSRTEPHTSFLGLVLNLYDAREEAETEAAICKDQAIQPRQPG